MSRPHHEQLLDSVERLASRLLAEELTLEELERFERLIVRCHSANLRKLEAFGYAYLLHHRG